MTHQISVRSNGLSFAAEADETLLEAALRQGLTLPYGCRSGACGACRGHIEHGEIDPGPYKPFAISEADIAAGAALFCCARAKSDLVVEAAITRGQQIEAKIIPVRVEALTLRAPDVMEILLCLPANETFPFLAGQFVDFLLPEGKRRSYSIANAPEKEGVLELHVRKVPGGHFTEQVFSTLKVKDVLRLEGPQGGFFLRESDKPAILLASGTGFAPIKAIVEHALATGDKRAFHLFWGCRKEADLYHDLPQRWAREYPLIRYTPVLSDPDAGWTGATGFVHQAVLQSYPDLSGHQVYACGNPAMVDAARADFQRLAHLPEAEFFSDAFTFQ